MFLLVVCNWLLVRLGTSQSEDYSNYTLNYFSDTNWANSETFNGYIFQELSSLASNIFDDTNVHLYTLLNLGHIIVDV